MKLPSFFYLATVALALGGCANLNILSRCADLLVKNALTSPRIMQELKGNPVKTLQTLGRETVEMLPRTIGDPTPPTTDAIGTIVIRALND